MSANRLGRYGTAKFFALVFVFLFTLLTGRPEHALAVTGSGTVISNTATITFSDANSNGFLTASNTVTTTVQNAPTLTVTAPGGQSVSPGMVVVDTFILANTGNAIGAFELTADATFAGTASGTQLLGYVLNGAVTGQCSVGSPCTESVLKGQSGMSGVAAAGTITVGVAYTAPIGATIGLTVQPTLSATASYASVTDGAAEVSPAASATATDTVINDARMDVQARATTPDIGNPTITWTITANDGGGFAAQGLVSAKTLFAAPNNGIVIFIPMPSFGTTYLQLQAPPASPDLNGASVGAIATVYYNAASCASHPVTLWNTNFNANAECLAVYVSNSIPSVLPSAPSQSSAAGAVTSPQITFIFNTNQPIGAGASNANSVTMIASSAIGGNPWAVGTGVDPIIGQGITPGPSSNIDAANAGLLDGVQANTTQSSGITPPGGASNQAGSNAFVSTTTNALLNGPYGAPGATGWYPGATGTVSADNMHDFTAFGVACTSNGASGVNGSLCSVGTDITIINELQNTGTQPDSIQVTASAPTGWTVQLYTTTTGTCTVDGSGWPTCARGAAITASASTDGGSVIGSVFLASGATLIYEAVYTATGNSATPFTAYTAKITATGQGGTGTGTDTNDSYNTLYPGSVILATTAVAVTKSNCPTGISPANAGACPGGTLLYSITYANVVPAVVGANFGNEPAFAVSALSSNAGSALLIDDGTLIPNNWATYTNGIAAAAADTTPNTIFTYYPSGSTTFSATQTKLTAQIGGTGYRIGPGASGTVTFTVIVNQ